MSTRILHGAFTKTLREKAHRIKILWQHDEHDPIGVPLELREDSRGLFLRARLSTSRRGQQAAQLLREGIMSELSIGFDPIRFEIVDEHKIWPGSTHLRDSPPRAFQVGAA